MLCRFTIGESRITDFVLMGSMAAGRIGLWSYDLVITQLVQDNVAETERGIFSISSAPLIRCFVVMHVGDDILRSMVII